MGGRLIIGEKFATTTKSTSYSLAASDIGTLINTNSSVQVDQNIFTVGNAITIFNNSSSNISIIEGSNITMYLAGTSTTGNRTLAEKGIATILCVSSNTFVASGAGLS